MSDMKYLIEKATSSLLLEPDWDTTLQIVDRIRQGDVTPKYTISLLLTILDDSNPNVVLQALHVLEAIVKNCGQVIHEYVATRDSMDQIHVILQKTSNDKVRNKLLALLATWVYAFRNESKYRAVQDTVNIMKAEGYHIPSVSESDAMFTADRAPEWADGECCHRCRSQFSILRRKHHCRACGQVFCSDCSSKYSTIPKFGIERDVRVCDSCYEDINNPQPKAKVESSTADSKPTSKSAGNTKSAQELQEEEELLLALALSKSEAENKEKKLRSDPRNNSMGGSCTPSKKQIVPQTEPDTDPELAKYLNRSYWEEHRQKNLTETTEYKADIIGRSSPPPSAPQNIMNTQMPIKVVEAYQNGSSEELDDFMATLRSQLEIFVNRMKSNQSRGRPIANDSAVQSLFMNITAMHAQLLKHIQEQDRKRVHYEQLQDKISQVRDARAALEALREEHKDKLRMEKEEQERQRQIQMMQKLEIMRKKKQEYLEYQRQLALHRMAESERQIFNQAPVPPAAVQGFAPIPFQTGYSNQPVSNYMPPQGQVVPQFGNQQQNIPNSNGFSTGTAPPPSPIQQNIASMQPPITSPQQTPAGQNTSEFGIYNMQGLVHNLPLATTYNSIPTSVQGQIPIDSNQRQHEIATIPPSQNEEHTELISFD